MDSPAIPVFLAGPVPVVHHAVVNEGEGEVALDVALLIGGIPNLVASTTFALDDSWDRIVAALASGDARLGVAGVPHEEEAPTGVREWFPSAYVGLECANGERLVLSHIRGLDSDQKSEAYAREVIDSLKQGQMLFAYYPDERWLTGSRYLGCRQDERITAGGGALHAAAR